MARRKVQQRSQLPLFLILAGVVLILGVLIYAAVSGRGNTGGAATGGDVPYATIQRVTLADAKGAYDQKTAVFLDVRDADSYKAGHIPGAINIPLANLESRLNELNRDQWIITYCT